MYTQKIISAVYAYQVDDIGEWGETLVRTGWLEYRKGFQPTLPAWGETERC